MAAGRVHRIILEWSSGKKRINETYFTKRVMNASVDGRPQSGRLIFEWRQE